MSVTRPSIAAFDFDGTLTYYDTLFSFLITGCRPLTVINHSLKAAPQMTGFLMGLVSRQAAKEALLTQFMSNTSCEEWQERAFIFAKQRIPFLLHAKAMQRLYWHQSQGHFCVLISANLGLYLRPWAESTGFCSVIASELEVSSNGLLTGHLATLNCWGPEKVKRLNQLLGPRESYYLYAYGDSRGDKELLNYADESYLNLKRIEKSRRN